MTRAQLQAEIGKWLQHFEELALPIGSIPFGETIEGDAAILLKEAQKHLSEDEKQKTAP